MLYECKTLPFNSKQACIVVQIICFSEFVMLEECGQKVKRLEQVEESVSCDV